MDADAPAQVPGYAWSWLQRSRPVLAAVAQRLTGGPPGPDFLDRLRVAYATDEFTRAMVADVVAEVAFSGRVPAVRPRGASWDRGLTWWAAALSGTTPRAFEAAGLAQQRRLFGEDAAAPQAVEPPPGRLGVSRERHALAEALRDLVRGGQDQVPASAIRSLADTLDPNGS